ncbi:MAG: cache domain-containing protein [Spirochaetales bacterium]|nr:cache domain-containing protein [Spirochaetales bacterium]
MRLANRIFFSFLGIILLSVAVSAAMGAVLISDAVRSEAMARVELGLQEARSEVQNGLDSLAVSARIHAQGLAADLAGPEPPDFVSVHPAGLPSFLRKHGLAATSGQTGFLLLSREDFERLGYEPSFAQSSAACDDGSLLCQFAAAEGTSGTAVAFQVLSGNEALVRDLQESLFGTQVYAGKPFGTVTIFCRDVRVATTVLGPEGELAVGTRVSAEVREKVLERGETWLRRAFVVDSWYLSGYEPLRDPGGRNIGILYVGVLERKYKDLRNRAVGVLSALVVPMLGLALLMAYFVARGVVRPLSEMVRAAGMVGDGRFDGQVGAEAGDREIRILAEAFHRMQQALKEREGRLRDRARELDEANRDYQELLSFVTHELNNSIGSLLLNVSLLAEEPERRMDPDSRSLAEQVLRDVERFRDMVRNYLNLSRLEKGTLRYRPQTFDLRARVIEPAVARLERWIVHRGFAVEWEWPGEVAVHGDPDLLDIVYSNFVVNALKYGRSWIRFSARREGASWVLGVANGGAPIPQEKIPLLFQKFSRLVQSDDGAGLGLYLVRRIIERHGGEVWCQSEEREGTSFYLRIPDRAEDPRPT